MKTKTVLKSIMLGASLLSTLMLSQAHLIGVAMAKSGLIGQVFSLPKPERFHPTPVDNMVKEFVSIGQTKDQVIKTLSAEGLIISDQEKETPFEDCKDCDKVYLVGRYNHKPALSMLYDYSLVVHVGFRSGKSAVVHGWYVQNIY